MGVGGVRGGGRKGGPAGSSSSSAAGGAKGGGFAGKVDSTSGLVGPSGLAGGGNVGIVDPATASALEIAKMLKSGEIKTRQEATRRLVSDILKKTIRMKSQALTAKIAEYLENEPREREALDRLWGKGDDEK